MKQFAKTAVLFALRSYKWLLSPLLPPACRYVPTCSEYAMEAVEIHGVLRGGAMAVWRVLRCHPLARGGFDPVSRTGNSLRGQPCPRQTGLNDSRARMSAPPA